MIGTAPIPTELQTSTFVETLYYWVMTILVVFLIYGSAYLSAKQKFQLDRKTRRSVKRIWRKVHLEDMEL